MLVYKRFRLLAAWFVSSLKHREKGNKKKINDNVLNCTWHTLATIHVQTPIKHPKFVEVMYTFPEVNKNKGVRTHKDKVIQSHDFGLVSWLSYVYVVFQLFLNR